MTKLNAVKEHDYKYRLIELVGIRVTTEGWQLSTNNSNNGSRAEDQELIGPKSIDQTAMRIKEGKRDKKRRR